MTWVDHRSYRRCALAVALAVALLMSLSTPAFAEHTATADLTIAHNGSAFSGTLTSDDDQCEPGRVVTIFRVEGNDDVAVGNDLTDESGVYEVPASVPAGSYYASVAASSYFTYGGSGHTCSGTTSDVIPVTETTPTPTPSDTVSPTPLPEVASTVSLGHDGTNFFGTVASTATECEVGRTVNIYKLVGDTRTLIGTATTDADGLYRLERSRASGDFVAEATQRTTATANCTAAESATFTVVPAEDVEHPRTAEITKIKHVDLAGKNRPGLKVRGEVFAATFEGCHMQVPIKVQLRADGQWLTRKSDVTDDDGVFKVLVNDVRGKYRVVANQTAILDNFAQINNICLRATDTKKHTKRQHRRNR